MSVPNDDYLIRLQETVFDKEAHTLEAVLKELQQVLVDSGASARVNAAYVLRRLELIQDVAKHNSTACHDELLEWHDPDKLQPDDKELVLVHVTGLVYPGYFDVDRWRWADAGTIDQNVIEWAKMPKGKRKES